MSTIQVNIFSYRTKGGVIFDLSLDQNGGIENIGEYRDQGSTTAHRDVVSGEIG